MHLRSNDEWNNAKCYTRCFYAKFGKPWLLEWLHEPFGAQKKACDEWNTIDSTKIFVFRHEYSNSSKMAQGPKSGPNLKKIEL